MRRVHEKEILQVHEKNGFAEIANNFARYRSKNNFGLLK